MAQKLLLVVVSALVAVSNAVVVPGPGLALPGYPSLAAPVYPKLAAPIYPGLAKVAVAKVAGPEPYDPNPQYSFSYDVHVSGRSSTAKLRQLELIPITILSYRMPPLAT